MNLITISISLFFISDIGCEIESSVLLNRITHVKPVGKALWKSFVPLTEIPPPHAPHNRHGSGRRHMPEECTQGPIAKNVFDGAKVAIVGDYYDDMVAKTMATVIMPDHIDYKHFQITTQEPYFTIRDSIEAIGYHPSTIHSEHPSECEKIYQDHMEDLYSDDTTDYSEESLEMAKVPINRAAMVPKSLEQRIETMYDNI